jgi:hypothetical protein
VEGIFNRHTAFWPGLLDGYRNPVTENHPAPARTTPS